MKTQTNVSLLFILFLSGLFMVPILGESATMSSERITVDESVESGIMPREIRVAVYDEPNFTAPVYATSPGGVNNNASDLATILEAAGYTVDLLDVHDIYNYALKTADYDVFVMCDNFPRENITDRVVDFWSGGGGVLSFDGSSGFLCYFGILPAAAAGTSGSGTYWNYAGNDIVIMERHPVTKSYTPGLINTGSGYLVWDFPSLVGATGGDAIKLASTSSDPNEASVVAFDPSQGGGKIVTIAYDLDSEELPELNDMFIDAVDWLAPRPKGRILYDYTNMPYYGIDEGDPQELDVARYAPVRDEWVRKTFTLDKLFPGEAAELNSDILEKYDMLVISTPLYSYTASEIDVIQSWVEDGGGLLLMGEVHGSFATHNENIRDIIAGYDMNITTTNYPGGMVTTNITLHPVSEAVTSLEISGGSFVESWGDAYPLVFNQTSSDEFIVAQEIGNGRVILSGDINFLDNVNLGDEDNTQFSVNIANWLCSDGAEILLYTDGKSSLGPNYNFYRSPAALALNELGVDYYMTNERDYFNVSLKLQSWDLLIIDANNEAPATSHPLIRDHIESGGRVIWRDFMFRQSAYNDMWNYLGWDGLDSTISAGPPTVYQWDTGHPIFTKPVNYGADNFSSSANVFATDYANVSIFDNATAIAGTTLTPNENTTAIVLSHGNRVLCNMMAISEYTDDTDDSTYADGYELFINEIAYMLRPSVNHPVDIEYIEGETGNEIVWLSNCELPFEYSIEMNGTSVHSDSWNGGAVSYNIDGLTNGTYIYTIMLSDVFGYSVSDSVTVSVLPHVAPTNTTTTPTGGGGTPIDPTLILILAGVGGVVVIVIIIIVMKKK